MSKYIDRDKLAEFARHSTIGIDANDIMRFPTADVVEVEPLCKRIKADLEEANETLTNSRYQYMSESAKAFQQGRVFAHKFDLLQIERIKEEIE